MSGAPKTFTGVDRGFSFKTSLRQVAFLLCILSFAMGCDVFYGPDRVEISPEDPSITVGATQQFRLRAFYTNPYSNEDKTGVSDWSSSNPSVATVSNVGLATAVAPGVTVIEGKYKDHSDDTTLTVASP